MTITGRNPAGLGDQAMASFVTYRTPSATTGVPWTVPQIALVVRSGNAIIALTYAVYAGLNSPPKPTTAALLADTIAMARGVLAGRPAVTAAAPAAYTSPRGLLYVPPRDPCGLVKTSTLVRYAPGVSPAGTPQARGSYADSPQQEACFWNGDAYSVDLFVSVYAPSGAAESQIADDVEVAHGSVTGTFTGSRSVSGLGNQATAVSITDGGNAPEIDLYVWEANVAVDVIFSVTPPGAPPSRAAMMTADTAIVQEVLADLPRS